VTVPVLALAACGDDDGEEVRETSPTGTAASEPASGDASASGSGSASGSAIEEAAQGAGTDDPLLLEAVAGYRSYLEGEVDELVSDAKRFTDAVRAGDIDEAKVQYPRSRVSWERIEPAASLVEELDGKLDSRVDDFTGPDDPAWTGWHRIEYDLWEQEEITDETEALADQLDADLATLQAEVPELPIPAAVVAVGASELIEEASVGKLTGEEDRYSKTDLWSIAANVEGSLEAFELLEPALAEAGADALVADIEAQFDRAGELLEAYEEGDGYQPFDAVTDEDLDRMKATLAPLSELLSQVAGELGLA